MSNSFTCPAISVVIPLYNAEKYIGECLESVLAQSFQNFEVIVVDDCSTDNSVAIVKSYVEKFGGRLKLSRTIKNSGSGATPKSKGLSLSRGEYVSFLDNDDTITQTAFEELYTLAKNYKADVVACEKYYNIPENLWYNVKFRAQLKPFSYLQGECVREPAWLSTDITERIKEILNRKFLWNIWSKLIRRDLILENEFLFADGIITDDVIFTICLVCTAKNFLRVPNVINNYRIVENSLSHVKNASLKHFKKYVREWVVGFKYLDKFLSEREFFRQNPHAKYILLETHLNEMLNYIIPVYNNVPPSFLEEVLRSELGNNMAAFIFNLSNVKRLQTIQMQQQFNQFAAQAQARIAELEAALKRKD